MAMPALPLNAVEQGHLDLMAPDLRFIMAEREIEPRLQALLGAAGYKSLGLFTSMVDNRAQLRAVLATDFGLDAAEANLAPATALARRVDQARIVDAWDTARKRSDEADRMQAEQRASRLPLTLNRAAHINLRSRYERDFGRLNDRNWPCQALIERRFEEVDEGEVRADPLSEVVSAEELVEDPVGAVIDRDGAIRLRRAPRSVALPTGSEELRQRVKVLGITFQLAAYKHSSRLWLASTSPEVWQQHLDYILGDKVGGLMVRTNETTIRPPWSVILAYEFQVRKTACKMVMFDNKDFMTAMSDARHCLETKEQHFSTPTAMSLSLARAAPKRAWQDQPANDVRPPKGGKAGGKKGGQPKGGQAADRGKGKGKQKNKFTNVKTPDGRNICFKYQNNTCNMAGCKFVHVCPECFGAHPLAGCPQAGGAGH